MLSKAAAAVPCLTMAKLSLLLLTLSLLLLAPRAKVGVGDLSRLLRNLPGLFIIDVARRLAKLVDGDLEQLVRVLIGMPNKGPKRSDGD